MSGTACEQIGTRERNIVDLLREKREFFLNEKDSRIAGVRDENKESLLAEFDAAIALLNVGL